MSNGAILGVRVGGASDFQASDVSNVLGAAKFASGAAARPRHDRRQFHLRRQCRRSRGPKQARPQYPDPYGCKHVQRLHDRLQRHVAAFQHGGPVPVHRRGLGGLRCATLAVNAGGTGEFTNATSGPGSIGGLLSSVNWQYGGNALGIDTTNAGGSLAYAGNVSGNEGVLKLGPGTLTLTGNLTYGGATTVNGGCLALVLTNTASSPLNTRPSTSPAAERCKSTRGATTERHRHAERKLDRRRRSLSGDRRRPVGAPGNFPLAVTSR